MSLPRSSVYLIKAPPGVGGLTPGRRLRAELDQNIESRPGPIIAARPKCWLTAGWRCGSTGRPKQGALARPCSTMTSSSRCC